MLLDREGKHVGEVRMDETIQDVGRALLRYRKRVSFALIEQVNAMPKQGIASAFKFGQAYGMQQAMVAILGWRYELIRPQEWQAQMRCRKNKKTKDKNVTKSAAQQLFPDIKVMHRNADALLLAELARRIGKERGW